MSTRVGDGVADIFDSCQEDYESLEPESESGVRDGPVLPEVEVELVVCQLESICLDLSLENVEAVFSDTSSDQLADQRHQKVHSLDSLAILVVFHVESLDLLGVIVDEDGAVHNLLTDVSFVLGSKVDSPAHGELELDFFSSYGLLENFDGLGILHASERSLHGLGEVGDQLFVFEALFEDVFVEELKIFVAVLEDVLNTELDVGLSNSHVVFQLGEGHFGLNHPKFGQVSGSMTHLRTESGTEGVNIGHRTGEGLDCKLSRDSKEGLSGEEVLLVVDLLVLFPDGNIPIVIL